VTVLDRVSAERDRQDNLAAAGRWGGATIATVDDGRRLAVLVEEVGEVARALQDGTDPAVELVQVAAVAVAWLEALER
jgi:hypothetical protein